ncbi:hypothetical protein N9N67_05945 [Bacteriovoracaceae bacterium]|nr:hypothetical protein [Bacteriovoracaceae bacterium]
MKKTLNIFLMLLPLISLAQTISFPEKTPLHQINEANDLTDSSGKLLSKYQVHQMRVEGKDISLLNPRVSNLYLNKPLPISNMEQNNFPAENATVSFEEESDSPTGVYRSTVRFKNNSPQNQLFTLSASLLNHGVIINAGLMRLMGYNVDLPKYYHELNLEFPNETAKKGALKFIGEKTLLLKDKWITGETQNTLKLKGAILEPSQIKSLNLYWPYMSIQKQESRRIFRALLLFYVLTDFPQSINHITWSEGRKFNQNIILNHEQAAAFKNLTPEDARWLLHKLSAITKSQIEKVISFTQYPQEVQDVVVEKIISRLNHFFELFNLGSDVQKFPLNNNIKKISNQDFSRWVPDFYQPSEKSPYRFSQVFKFLRHQVISNALTSALSWAQKEYVPNQDMTTATESIRERVLEYRQTQGQNQGILPLKSWSKALFGARAFATRNIVFGNFLASDAPIQIVDSIGVEGEIGGLSIINKNLNKALPVGVSLSLSKSYSHVRPTDSIEEASSKPIKELWIPRLMKNLGKIFTNEISCDISEKPFVQEEEVKDVIFKKIIYDKTQPEMLQKALDLKEELISNGTPANKILISGIDRKSDCEKQLLDKRKNLFKDFNDSLAENETFVINNQIKLSPFIGTNVPIGFVPGLSAGIHNEINYIRLKTTMMRKVGDQLEITIQQRKDLENFTRGNITYLVNLVSMGIKFTKGKMNSLIYRISLNDLSEEKMLENQIILSQIFLKNNFSALKSKGQEVNLDHKVLGRLTSFNFLFWKSDKLKMNHTVEITNQAIQEKEYTGSDIFFGKTREFYSIMDLKRTGNDFLNFFDRMIKTVSSFIGLGTSNPDPGQTPLGKSKRFYSITETELTPEIDPRYTSRIEIIHTGWATKMKRVKKTVRTIESYFVDLNQSDHIDMNIFKQTRKLRSYDFRTTFILYPNFYEKMKYMLLKNKDIKSILSVLTFLYTHKKWNEFCARTNNEINFYDKEYRGCVPPDAQRIVKLIRKKVTANRKTKTKRINKFISTLFREFSINRILKMAPEESYFATTRITGFREKDPTGYLDYMANTVGKYNSDIGTGIMDQVAKQLGITSFELRAISYTPGMY